MKRYIDSKCWGTKPIQLEVAARIRKEFPNDWIKAIRDKDLKETTRLEIYDDYGGDWCDSVKGTCVCGEWRPDKPNATNLGKLNAMFPNIKGTA